MHFSTVHLVILKEVLDIIPTVNHASQYNSFSETRESFRYVFSIVHFLILEKVDYGNINSFKHSSSSAGTAKGYFFEIKRIVKFLLRLQSSVN